MVREIVEERTNEHNAHTRDSNNPVQDVSEKWGTLNLMTIYLQSRLE
jgi:hypothetical protein